MDFILTYNISDDIEREIFENKIESKFPNSLKEKSNQTTLVANSESTIEKVIENIKEIAKSITKSSNNAITIYYPFCDKNAKIRKAEIMIPQTNEALDGEIETIKYLIKYKSF